jgi:serine/threonine-protein kinase
MADQPTKPSASPPGAKKPEPAAPEDLVGTKIGARPAGLKTTPDAEDLISTKVGDDRSVPVKDATQRMPPEESREASAPALADEAAAKNLSTLKDFRLIKKLGEGGMGTVYKAHQLSLDRIVAVKVPFRHLAKDPSFVARFYREARIMARLDHPNILRCYSVGEENGWHYLAMEYIDGASMQSWLEKLKKLSVGDALHVALACAHALQHAHEQNLIHRDIKPDNILVTNKGVVKVADMGLAKALTNDLSLSRTGTGAGTPHYMAPEQARDAKHVDGRSDIYALGSMLYCFLTGAPPFKGETYVDLLLEKEKGKFTPSRRSNSEIPERLDLILDKAMAAKPDLRYKTCSEFIKDLETLNLANEALSFIPNAVASVTVKSGMPTKQVSTPPKPAAPPGAKPAVPGAKPSAPAAGDVWYLAIPMKGGKTVKRKMTTAQAIELIKKKDFDLGTLASKTLKGQYRNLNYYKEFAGALQSRLAQAKADRKTAKFHSAYDKILADEKSYKFKRKMRDLFQSARGLVTFIIFLIVLLGLLSGAAYYIYTQFVR